MKKLTSLLLFTLTLTACGTRITGVLPGEDAGGQVDVVPGAPDADTSPVHPWEPDAGDDTGAPDDGRVRGIVLSHIDGRGFGTETSAASLDTLRGLGVSWVSLSVYGHLDDRCDETIRDEWLAPDAPGLDPVREQIRQAHARGVAVLLSPTLYVHDGWRGELGQCDDGTSWDEAAWGRFWQGYEAFVLSWVDLAAEESAEIVSLGLEMKTVTARDEAPMEALIAAARQRFAGRLTYSANWDEIEQVDFWPRLDFVGINAFFPLTDQPDATPAQLAIGAQQLAARLAGLQAGWGRPILFTEVGYKSYPDAAIRPWEWPQDVDPLDGDSVDEAYQAAAYEAIFTALWDRPWFAGMFWWKSFTDLDSPDEEPWGFTPIGKQAEAVMARWYRGD